MVLKLLICHFGNRKSFLEFPAKSCFQYNNPSRLQGRRSSQKVVQWDFSSHNNFASDIQYNPKITEMDIYIISYISDEFFLFRMAKIHWNFVKYIVFWIYRKKILVTSNPIYEIYCTLSTITTIQQIMTDNLDNLSKYSNHEYFGAVFLRSFFG